MSEGLPRGEHPCIELPQGLGGQLHDVLSITEQDGGIELKIASPKTNVFTPTLAVISVLYVLNTGILALYWLVLRNGMPEPGFDVESIVFAIGFYIFGFLLSLLVPFLGRWATYGAVIKDGTVTITGRMAFREAEPRTVDLRTHRPACTKPPLPGYQVRFPDHPVPNADIPTDLFGAVMLTKAECEWLIDLLAELAKRPGDAASGAQTSAEGS